MTTADLKPCPNPWCEAEDRGIDDYPPVMRLHHFGTYRVVCSSCVLEGPLRQTQEEAVTAWNDRGDSVAAQGGEAGTAKTGTGLVHEHPVGNADAPIPHPHSE